MLLTIFSLHLIIISFLFHAYGSSDHAIDLQSDLQKLRDEVMADSSANGQSLLPHLPSMTFKHQHYPEEYSFNEWEWSSFRQLLLASQSLCQRNAATVTWTLPVKCEYYMIIRALRAAKDRESDLSEHERSLIQEYIDTIYGKAEVYSALKEKLKYSFASNSDSDDNSKPFRLKTILETNEVDHLINNRFIAQEKILEKCSSLDGENLFTVNADATIDSQTTKESISIAFLHYLPKSTYQKFIDGRYRADQAKEGGERSRMSDLPFFQSFARSFLHYQKSHKEHETPWDLSFSLFVGFDLSAFNTDQSPEGEQIEQEEQVQSFKSFIQDFYFACNFFFDFFEEISLQGYDLSPIFHVNSFEHYFYSSIIARKEESFYFLPFIYQQLIKATWTSTKIRKKPDYFFFIRDSFVVTDPSFFHRSLYPLRYQNYLLPNFGLSLSLPNDRNDVIVLHRDYFKVMENFPLSVNVLNSSYLNDLSEERSWNHFYFTMIDIFSVFQPSLRRENDFLHQHQVNHSFLTHYHSHVEAREMISEQYVVNIERYKVLIERARRHLGKWLHTNDLYVLYHTCINDEMVQRLEGQQEYFHPIQFYWRPNQLLYEVNGLFSIVNF